MREFLKGLELDKETIDSIMAEHGKLLTESKEKTIELENKIKEYETTINDLNSKSEDSEKIAQELATLKENIAKENARKEAEEKDKNLTNNILGLFEGKTFTSEYAKQGLLNDIKNGLNNPDNQGKGIKDLYEELTKDKTDIFANPNPVKDMPSMGESEQETATKDVPMFW